MSFAELTCANCTAPLGTEEKSPGVLVCSYCGRAHRFAKPPPAPRVHRHPRGSAVVVEWSGKWWDAHVLEVIGENAWQIHYDGWASNWNEVVGPDRIRDRSQAAHLPRPANPKLGVVIAAVIVLVVVGGASFSMLGALRGSSGPTSAPSGQLAGPDTPLVAGQAIMIEWNGVWYRGSVVALEPGGTVRIHYDGYSTGYDESVPRSRISVP
jgi:hypothetical protein